MQKDLFGIQNQLQGVRICLNGSFSLYPKALNKMLKELGVKEINRVSTSREYKEDDMIPPVKEGTNIYVIGENPNEESIKRYEMNVHDGFKALKINEAQLMELITGASELVVPKSIIKHLDLTIDYIHWQAPTINDKVFVSRVSSPLKYDLEGMENSIYMKEIYVPDFPSVNMMSFRQIIGNLGGYANNQFYDDTDIVMLSSNTVRMLELGEKDEVIMEIENRYNNSGAKIFNVQFTTEEDFLKWLKVRMEKFPDEPTIKLMKNLKTK